MLIDSKVGATIPVKDIGKSRGFYEDVLGFKAVLEDEAGIKYEAGFGSFFYIYPSSFAGTNQATAVTFDTADLDAEVKELRSRGITFEEYDFPDLKTVDGIASIGDKRGAWFKDPDGNILAVGEDKG